jgi:hypothetical protein
MRPSIRVLLTIPARALTRYQEHLTKESQLHLTFTHSVAEAKTILVQQSIDAFVVDNSLGNVHELIKELRTQHPRLWVVMVDEDADFAMPGRADAATVEPFKNDDLVKKIKRLAEERRLETLHADTLAPVKAFARSLAKAGKDASKPQAAVDTVRQLGYEYVAYYAVVNTVPPSLTLVAQSGEEPIRKQSPAKLDHSAQNLLGWVAQNGQSKIVSKGDALSYSLIDNGVLQMVACTHVGNTIRFGVLVAGNSRPESIAKEGLVILELISGQLAAALAKEARN